MKSSMMAESATPDACICAILSFAGWEKLQPSMLQLATVSGQPHWQANLEPTRRIFCVVLAIWAEAAAASTRAKNTLLLVLTARLLLDRNILFGNANYFRARVLQLDLARNQRNQSPENQHNTARPDPAHQREHISLD